MIHSDECMNQWGILMYNTYKMLKVYLHIKGVSWGV